MEKKKNTNENISQQKRGRESESKIIPAAKQGVEYKRSILHWGGKTVVKNKDWGIEEHMNKW